MKYLLFCKKNYSISIMMPIRNELKRRGLEYAWFMPPENEAPIRAAIGEDNLFLQISDLKRFKADVNFVPGDEIPYFLHGVKVQIFHGLAGEKKGSFRIRHYFDLYLTQGPYYTENFLRLKKRYKDFEVRQTGWSKLDSLFTGIEHAKMLRENLLANYSCKKLVLYAPTFSPSLTSAKELLPRLKEIVGKHREILLLVKFHDLMAAEVKLAYKAAFDGLPNAILSTENDILPLMKMADLMLSDTSSVVYEFLLLNKPVVTFKSTSPHVKWCNYKLAKETEKHLTDNLYSDAFAADRKWFFDYYHPYADGLSASRMIDAVEDYIAAHGVPVSRKLSFFRRRKINKAYGEA